MGVSSSYKDRSHLFLKCHINLINLISSVLGFAIGKRLLIKLNGLFLGEKEEVVARFAGLN